MWYLDDGTIAGSPAQLLLDFATVKEESKKIGLEVNVTKSEIYCQNGINISELDTGLKILHDSEVFLLGGALTENSIDSLMIKKHNLLKLFQERLSLLPHHQALFLLKTSFGFPRFTHALRSTPCWHSRTLLQMDETLKQILEEILNVSLDHPKWLQASLPVNKGGLGIRRFEQLSLPAFIASAVGTERLVKVCLSSASEHLTEDRHLAEASGMWLQLTNKETPPQSFKQKEWDGPVCDVVVQSLLNCADDSEKARLSAAAAKHGSEWLHAMPITTCGLALSNDELRISVCLRLGLQFFRRHQCKCGEAVDEMGQHCFTCK